MCFIAIDAKTGKVVARKGTACETRISPCSTFKIPLALMGYEMKVLQDETHPEWPFTPRPDGEEVNVQQQISHNPKSWMSNSIVWYSQVLTPKIGLLKFKKFVEQFNYGNKDVSCQAYHQRYAQRLYPFYHKTSTHLLCSL